MQYQELINQVDSESMTPKELAVRLFGNTQWHNLWATARIYRDAGGTRFSHQEFLDLVNPRRVLIQAGKPLAL